MNKIKEIVSYNTKYEVINEVICKDKSRTIKQLEYQINKYNMIRVGDILYIYDKFDLLK